MKKAFLACTIALLMVVLFPAQGVGQGKKTTAAISKADEQTLVNMEREAWENVKKKDWNALDRVMTANFVWIDDGGIIVGKADATKRFTGFDLTGYNMENVKVTAFAPQVAFVTYGVTLQGRFEGQPILAKPSYVGSGYVKRGGKWLNFFTQSTLSH
jgi:ketosteroid isomerase-like protein